MVSRANSANIPKSVAKWLAGRSWRGAAWESGVTKISIYINGIRISSIPNKIRFNGEGLQLIKALSNSFVGSISIHRSRINQNHMHVQFFPKNDEHPKWPSVAGRVVMPGRIKSRFLPPKEPICLAKRTK